MFPENPYPIVLLLKVFPILFCWKLFPILFKLKSFQLKDRIKKDHPIFQETYFLFVLFNTVYVAKKIDNETLKFDYVEILNGIRIIRKMKLKKLYQ